jgi:hypothetical protein
MSQCDITTHTAELKRRKRETNPSQQDQVPAAMAIKQISLAVEDYLTASAKAGMLILRHRSYPHPVNNQ